MLSSGIGAIKSQAKTAESILEKVRSYARKKGQPRSLLNANEIVLEAVNTLNEAMLSPTKVTFSGLKGRDDKIWSDKTELELAVQNLLKNALHAVSSEKNPSVSVSVHKEKSSGGSPRIAISVSDNGPRLSDEAFEKLSSVLSSSKIDGLGLGLSIVPQTLPREVAAELGDLYVYYNDRICPLQTLAKDFTVKLCGKSRYRGLTPEQVLSGWLFYYDDWKREPMIRIRSAGARRLLEVGGRYARLSDFRNRVNEYRLEGAAGRPAGEADEKFNIIGMVCTGSMLRIFPYTDPSDSLLRWASQVDDLPRELPHGQALFIGRAMNYVSELVVKRDWAGVAGVLRKIRNYQQKEGGAHMPSGLRFRAEKLYNRLDWSLPLAAAFILIGIGGFLDACRRMVRGRAFGAKTRGWLLAGVAAGGLYLTLMLALRGYVSGHWPVSNGYETMRFMAWCTLLLTLLFARRFLFLLPFGYLIAGLSLMVSMMGESNPQITQLMPVLDSPLLCIHVMLVMVAYALLAFVMFGGVAGVVLHRRARGAAVQLQAVSRLMLYPAVFCLAAGIFVGAVWANVSWGRYWGWDPKEVWALVTLLVYALPLHAGSLPWFRRPLFFHWFCIAAFLSVLVTYFGVNFLLGGMHSYAG